METIENKVEKSGLIQISPEDYLPQSSEWFLLDFNTTFLDPEFPIVREKEFRQKLKEYNLPIQNENGPLYLGILLDENTLYPAWLEMLLTSHFFSITPNIEIGRSEKQILQKTALKKLQNESFETYKGKRLIVKGCSKFEIPDFLVHFIRKHQGAVKSIMFGEACSTVPIFKAK
ncbi:MAG: hypothetical protein ACJAY8_000062 [Sphingobacteriales bacterium]|jgi:hypothetical protein